MEAGVSFSHSVSAAGRSGFYDTGSRKHEQGGVPSSRYVFQLDEKEYVPGKRQDIHVETLLGDQKKLDDLQCIESYFQMLYHIKGQSGQKHILEGFQK